MFPRNKLLLFCNFLEICGLKDWILFELNNHCEFFCTYITHLSLSVNRV